MKTNPKKTALIPLAQGCEELEAVTMIDLLRRADIAVTTAGLDTGVVTASRGTRLIPDTTLDTALQREYALLALPGGLPGATHLDNDKRIIELVKKMAKEDKIIAAICAAPKVLLTAGVLSGRRYTAYPGTFDDQAGDATLLQDMSVVRDNNIITGSGPGAAMDFAFMLIEALAGKAIRAKIEAALLHTPKKAA